MGTKHPSDALSAKPFCIRGEASIQVQEGKELRMPADLQPQTPDSEQTRAWLSSSARSRLFVDENDSRPRLSPGVLATSN